jgi:hypothetical protein
MQQTIRINSRFICDNYNLLLTNFYSHAYELFLLVVVPANYQGVM